MTIQEYIHQLNEQFKTGNAREHSYRPMLQQLLNDMLHGFVVTNEPARISCGAPDYIITHNDVPVFFIEAKDINDSDLDGHNQHKEQFTRYKGSLDHIIFTDYLDFHLYEYGQWVRNVRIGEMQGSNIRLIRENVDAFNELVLHIADTHPTPITSATKLAQQMAAKARTLASTINEAFRLAEEDPEAAQQNQQLQSQLEAFRNVLIHDLTSEGFADIYAQTVAYGMFAARLHDDTPENFSRHEAATLIPKSNPFLRQIFQSIAGYDLDERIAWVVDDLVSIFLATDIKKVMDVYSKKEIHHDPMIHFYEDFLTAYNPQLRKAKGVWYTPQPVVQFIVRAVDEILQRDFNLADGLADHSMIEHEVPNEAYVPGEKIHGKELPRTITKRMHRVQILDPATGTGTFLAETVNQIYDKFRGMQGMWQGYVTDHLLPRLHGFELLMASYAVAHLKLDMLLQETGFAQSANQKRLKIYLTNSLEECHPDTGTLWSSWLSNEANEANRIKRDCPVMVMMGNPPYSISSSNKSEWITRLVEDYKQNLNERNIQPLSDDYIKFIRLAQDYVERDGEGIMAYISNNSFIDGIIHREMRHQLLLAYDDIYILNLHGNARKKEVAEDGSKDENVFDIMQGVSINIFVRRHNHQADSLGKVHYKDLYGLRDAKYDYLTNNDVLSVDWVDVEYKEPEYFFVPKDFGAQEEYDRGVCIDKLMVLKRNGIETRRDSIVMQNSVKDVEVVCNDFNNLNDIELLNKYPKATDSRDWKLSLAKNDLKTSSMTIRKVTYRPFDYKYAPYTGKCRGIMGYPFVEVMQHMLHDNTAVILTPQGQALGQDPCNGVYISDVLVDRNVFYRGGGICFPLYLYVNNMGTEEKIPNLKAEEWQKFDDAVGHKTTPEELLAYIYAVLHSPTYRERYKEFLKVDFPRIPLPASAEEFERLGRLGQQLIDLHLMKDTQTWHPDTTFPESGDCKVEQYIYADGKVWINNTQYFGGVPETAWNFFIGGYQPAQKWLKDRKGRTLTFDDIKHYFHIIYALTETERIMKEIG